MQTTISFFYHYCIIPPDDVITLASLNLPLTSSDIYAGVDFRLSEEGTDISEENT
ncbi:hypothetical protein CKA32_002985 [Geitlerinema sp. FC II]|nr:hypothetical protein CKA32_002985 [Geitlerinema sp. FC II]